MCARVGLILSLGLHLLVPQSHDVHAQAVSQCDTSSGKPQTETGYDAASDSWCRALVPSSIDFDARLAEPTAARLAIGIAASSPNLMANETYGAALNFGTYNGQTAIGTGALAVVAQDADGVRKTIVFAGAGVGMDQREYSGKIGIKFKW